MEDFFNLPSFEAKRFESSLNGCLNEFEGVAVKVCNHQVFMTFNGRRPKMNQFTFSTLFVAATLAVSLHTATGQAMNATVQTGAPRVAGNRGAPATAAKPAAAPRVAPQPTGFNRPKFNANVPRPIGQPMIDQQQHSYSPILRNPSFTALNMQRITTEPQPIALDPATRQIEMQTLAQMHQRRGIVTREGNVLDPGTRKTEMHTSAASGEQHVVGPNNQTFATINAQRHVTDGTPDVGPQQDKPEAPKDNGGKKWRNKKDHIGFNEAFGRHWHEWHDRNWWHNNCNTIVFVATGYYFLDGSYWYPAYGYDPLQSYYDYDGPIYTYSNLLPDEVIANVQTALQNAGYYYGQITGSLGVDTRAAIGNFQRDNGLSITGAIDAATVEALGLY